MADGILKVGQIQTSSGSGTITIGQSGETVNIPSGTTVSGAGANTPAFEAYLSSNQAVSDNTLTKVQFDTEVFDTDGAYDNSTNYRYTPQTSGKYFFYTTVSGFGNASADLNVFTIKFYKNGSSYKQLYNDNSGNPLYNANNFSGTVIDMNGSTDYVEVYGLIDGISAGSEAFQSSEKQTLFGAYKLIGA